MYPIADVVPLAVAHGARVVIVNGSPTAMDDLADAVVTGSISEVLPALVEGLPPSLSWSVAPLRRRLSAGRQR